VGEGRGGRVPARAECPQTCAIPAAMLTPAATSAGTRPRVTEREREIECVRERDTQSERERERDKEREVQV
jgi:hypothetical protein